MIESLYRVRCQPCERYLAAPGGKGSATVSTVNADLFVTFSSAYGEAVRRGWTAFPLICPDCAADLRKKIADGQE